MRVNYFPKKISKRKTTLLLGSFESFHLGHFELLKKARSIGKPISIMVIDKPNDIPFSNSKIYSSLDNRLQIFSNLKIDFASVVKFSEVKNMSGRDFIRKIVEATNASHLIMGEDFVCGFNRDYSAKEIARDYDSTIFSHSKINGKKISTSLLKEMLQLGEVDIIKKYALMPFSVDVKVIEKSFKINEYPQIQKGIYSTTIIINDIEYASVTKIGFKENIIKVPQLQIKNYSFFGKIIFHKLIKPIISDALDAFDEKSTKLAYDYLWNLK